MLRKTEEDSLASEDPPPSLQTDMSQLQHVEEDSLASGDMLRKTEEDSLASEDPPPSLQTDMYQLQHVEEDSLASGDPPSPPPADRHVTATSC